MGRQMSNRCLSALAVASLTCAAKTAAASSVATRTFVERPAIWDFAVLGLLGAVLHTLYVRRRGELAVHRELGVMALLCGLGLVLGLLLPQGPDPELTAFLATGSLMKMNTTGLVEPLGAIAGLGLLVSIIRQRPSVTAGLVLVAVVSIAAAGFAAQRLLGGAEVFVMIQERDEILQVNF